MKRFTLALIMLGFAGALSAQTIIEVSDSDPDFPGSANLSSNGPLAVSWTQAGSFSNVTIEAALGFPTNSGGSASIRVFLTRQLGAGTTPGTHEVAATGTIVVPNTVPNTPIPLFTLFTGLTLPSGTYYLSAFPVSGGTAAWDYENPSTASTDVGATLNGLFWRAPSIDGTYAPASGFTQQTFGPGFFRVTAEPPAVTKALDAPYQVRYASNLVHGDSVVNITNTGVNGAPLYGPGFGVAAGNLCVNVYAFSPDEQLISCCSCPVTPNGLMNLTANRDLVSNTLTGISPDSIVIKLVATATGSRPAAPPPPDSCVADACGQTEPSSIPTFSGSNCTNSAAFAGTDDYQVANGLLAWGTTLHAASEPASPASMALTETQFLPAKLSWDELKSIRERCKNIIGNGSTFGQCRSCRLGGLGGAKQ